MRENVKNYGHKSVWHLPENIQNWTVNKLKAQNYVGRGKWNDTLVMHCMQQALPSIQQIWLQWVVFGNKILLVSTKLFSNGISKHILVFGHQNEYFIARSVSLSLLYKIRQLGFLLSWKYSGTGNPIKNTILDRLFFYYYYWTRFTADMVVFHFVTSIENRIYFQRLFPFTFMV